jgi:hypothetical protein
VGGYRLRCLKDEENDIRDLKLKMRRRTAYNKKEWASVMKQAKILTGLQGYEAST